MSYRAISFYIFVAVVAVAAVVPHGAALAWAGPSQAAPSGNTPLPINVGSVSQVKSGSFWATAIGSDSGYCIGGSCISTWPTSPWTLSGTSLYYLGGSVGIQTSSPVATLDINGTAHLKKHTSAPVACAAELKGTIAYAGSGRLCVCNGTSWVFDYNAAACSWSAGDSTAPTVSITAPAGGATVSGTIAVNATASDNVGVAGVQFKLDGANLGAEDSSSPYSVSWNTTSTANGSHTLTAVARDAAGNTTTSVVVNVTVSNDTTAPTTWITSPAPSATVSGTIAVTATASDNVGVVGVQFKLNGANLGAEDTTSPYSVSWNTTGVANGSYPLNVVARDAAGNTASGSDVWVTVNNVVPGSQNYTAAGSYNFTVPAYNNLTIKVWGGGGGGGESRRAGSTGGQSSWNGIVSANGGDGGVGYGGYGGGAGGTASGGSINTTGNAGTDTVGGSAPGGGGAGGAWQTNGTAPGGGGGGGAYMSGAGGGGSGGYSSITYSAGQLTVGSQVSLVVGVGGVRGTDGYGNSAAGVGGTGGVYITWN
ncbi:Ig-like domain-containing protein [Candidatus Kaiserbacteria bacterium]|nr:Ig-like domain-containing protein [Candidatus Kaiserbacteria bacterium]